MPNWQEVGIDGLRAAKLLLQEGFWRSTISRSYYAAYAVVTSEIMTRCPTLRFRHGWRNPAHGDLPKYVAQYLKHLPLQTRKHIIANLRDLRIARETADYRPGLSADGQLSRRSVTLASAVFRDLEVQK